MGQGDITDFSEEYRQILQSLKATAEGLLINQVSNVWNIYGGLNRLHSVMEKIFKHGCRVFDQEGDPDCWIFIQGLSSIQPPLSISPSLLCNEENKQQLPPNVTGKALVWLYKSLEGHTLSQKLSRLLSDRDHLFSCFEKTAYLCQEKYGEATLICLKAVEQNQPSLLTEIDPCLYLDSWNFKVFHKTHRKCSSFPETSFNLRSHRKDLQLVKQSSADAQLITIMSRTGIKKSPVGTGCFGSDIQDADRIEDDDHQSFCEEATECTFVSDTANEDNSETSSKSDDASNVDTVTLEEIKSKMCTVGQTIKSWYSLPCVMDLCGSVNDNTSASNCDQTLYVHKRICKSHPSSPTRKSKDLSVLFSPVQSPKELLLNFGAVEPLSKLSPSVLEVDYNTSELQSDIDIAMLEKGNKKNKTLRNISRNFAKKYRVSDTVDIKTTPHIFKRNIIVLNRVVTNSESSDTLNQDGNVFSDSSGIYDQSSKSKISFSKPNSRPNELKLPSRHWSSSRNVGDKPGSVQILCPNKKHTRRHKNSVPCMNSTPEQAREWTGSSVCLSPPKRRIHKKSFIEDGGNSVLPMSTGFFPRPIQGQSLTSFLSSGQFARPSAELDRENAHFSICEAMIAAIELVKCNRQFQIAEERGEVLDESDEEINHLKQRIRMRRRQRLEERQNHLWGTSLLSDGKTDTTTTDQSVSPLSTSPGTPSESISTDDVDDLEVDEVKNLEQLKNTGLSVSMASLYSEADLSKHPHTRTPAEVTLTESTVSAEGVALSLIRQFSDKHLPRASELQWLVSEQDAPQQLLPLPTSWPVSPDEAEDADMTQATPLRGTMEWAPPRPQVIFTSHPNPVRRVLMAKQNYRCAGCGMKVATEYAHRFRYCEYLGRYFCTGCHTNQLALIPGRILSKWDFNRVPVSSFSYRLLDQMMGDPLFRIGDLNPALYRKARQLEKTRQLRVQLFYVKDFIFNCRFAEELQEELKKEPAYMLTELDAYSLYDLLQVKSGEMPNRIRELVVHCTQHVSECSLCQAHGFVCELCLSKEVIYPWQLVKVRKCPSCGACFHMNCWKDATCRRCARRSARQTDDPNVSKSTASVTSDLE